MRLARYAHKTGTSLGLVTARGVVPIAEHVPSAPDDMIKLIAEWDIYKESIAKLRDETEYLSFADIKLLAPILRPGKILGIGLNYKDHIAESGLETPTEQLWFSKVVTSVAGPFDAIKMPRISMQLDYEAELVFIIGKNCRYADRQQATASIFGYCAGNDISVRDWQFRTSQFLLGKSLDTSAPIGPWIVTSDELDASNLDIRCYVNNEERQHSNTRHLIFDCIAQIEYLSQVMTLEPGDVIFTGTPAGVGAGMKPQRWLTVGDRIRVEIEGIGAIKNVIESN